MNRQPIAQLDIRPGQALAECSSPGIIKGLHGDLKKGSKRHDDGDFGSPQRSGASPGAQSNASSSKAQAQPQLSTTLSGALSEGGPYMQGGLLAALTNAGVIFPADEEAERTSGSLTSHMMSMQLLLNKQSEHARKTWQMQQHVVHALRAENQQLRSRLEQVVSAIVRPEKELRSFSPLLSPAAPVQGETGGSASTAAEFMAIANTASDFAVPKPTGAPPDMGSMPPLTTLDIILPGLLPDSQASPEMQSVVPSSGSKALPVNMTTPQASSSSCNDPNERKEAQVGDRTDSNIAQGGAPSMDRDLRAGAQLSNPQPNSANMSDDIKREVSTLSVNVTLSERPLRIVQSREASPSVQRDPSQSSRSWSGSLIGRMSSKLTSNPLGKKAIQNGQAACQPT